MPIKFSGLLILWGFVTFISPLCLLLMTNWWMGRPTFLVVSRRKPRRKRKQPPHPHLCVHGYVQSQLETKKIPGIWHMPNYSLISRVSKTKQTRLKINLRPWKFLFLKIHFKDFFSKWPTKFICVIVSSNYVVLHTLHLVMKVFLTREVLKWKIFTSRFLQ